MINNFKKLISLKFNKFIKVVKILLKQLIECNILLEVNVQDSAGYVPASDIECLTILDVLTAFEQRKDI